MKFLQFLGGLDAGGAVSSIVDVSEIISISNTYSLRGVTTIQLRNKENVYSTESSLDLIERLNDLLKSNEFLSKKFEPAEEVLNEVNERAFNAIGYEGYFQKFDLPDIQEEELEDFRRSLNDFAKSNGFYYFGWTRKLRKEEPPIQVY